MTLVNDLIDLVLPAVCVSCGRAGQVWCPACRPPPSARQVSHSPAPVYAAGEYAGGLRCGLVAFKERGQRRLAQPLGGYLAHAVRALEVAGGSSDRRIGLVPVPSRRSAARERGGDHLLRLCREAAIQLGAVVLPVLRLTGRVRDSAGLSQPDRAANLDNRIAARREGTGERVVLVDDIVTTGATAREGIRALTVAGWQVEGVATIAATRRLFPSDGGA